MIDEVIKFHIWKIHHNVLRKVILHYAITQEWQPDWCTEAYSHGALILVLSIKCQEIAKK